MRGESGLVGELGVHGETDQLPLCPRPRPARCPGGRSPWCDAASSSAPAMSTQPRSSTPRSCRPEVGVPRAEVRAQGRRGLAGEGVRCGGEGCRPHPQIRGPTSTGLGALPWAGGAAHGGQASSGQMTLPSCEPGDGGRGGSGTWEAVAGHAHRHLPRGGLTGLDSVPHAAGPGLLAMLPWAGLGARRVSPAPSLLARGWEPSRRVTPGPGVGQGVRREASGPVAAPRSGKGPCAPWSPRLVPDSGAVARLPGVRPGRCWLQWRPLAPGLPGVWEARMQEPRGGWEAGGEAWLPLGPPGPDKLPGTDRGPAPSVPWEVGAQGAWPEPRAPPTPERPALADGAHHPRMVPGAELDF